MDDSQATNVESLTIGDKIGTKSKATLEGIANRNAVLQLAKERGGIRLASLVQLAS